MSDPQPLPAALPPRRPLQFSLQTLLLLFVVLGSSLAVFGVWGIVVFALAAGIAIWVRHAESLVQVAGIVVAVLVVAGVVALISAILAAKVAGRRASCMNKMHCIAQALDEYHKANGRFPPAYVADKNGNSCRSTSAFSRP